MSLNGLSMDMQLSYKKELKEELKKSAGKFDDKGPQCVLMKPMVKKIKEL